METTTETEYLLKLEYHRNEIRERCIRQAHLTVYTEQEWTPYICKECTALLLAISE